jgi:hypothetical protein
MKPKFSFSLSFLFLFLWTFLPVLYYSIRVWAKLMVFNPRRLKVNNALARRERREGNLILRYILIYT